MFSMTEKFLWRYASVLMAFSLLLPPVAHASVAGTTEAPPIVNFQGGGIWPTWVQACTAVMPACQQLPLPPRTACYSNPRGDFKPSFGPGCYYEYKITDNATGNVTYDDPNNFNQNWAVPKWGCPSGWSSNATNLNCTKARTRDDDCSTCKGNPIWSGTGQKTQVEHDFSLGGSASSLSLVRQYSSFNIDRQMGAFGIGWFLIPFDRRLILTDSTHTQVLRSGSERVYFTLVSGQWTSPWAKHLQLTQTGSVWNVKDESGNTVEDYDASGKLQAIHYIGGMTHTLTYSTSSTPSSIAPQPGLLIQVADSYGRTLSFIYDSLSRVSQVTDPAGQTYQYGYDATLGSLTSVTYPDTKTRNYLYEVANGPGQSYTTDATAYAIQVGGGTLTSTQYAGITLVGRQETVRRRLGDYDAYPLTGIVDENGNRMSTYIYGLDGKGASTEYAGAVQKYSFSYGAITSGTNSVTVTDPLGTNEVDTVSTVQGTARLQSRTQAAGAGSSAATTSYTYDTSGNTTSRTDFNGNKTCYAYDTTRNLETARVEGLVSSAVCSTVLSAGSLTAPARKISTQWHASYKLPLKIAEPKKLTTFTYDTAGNMLTRTEQATTDTSGVQNLTPTTTGTARTWTYTYNSVGQVLTVDGPRTDVTDVTTYVYDTSGNLTSITDAAGNVTALSSYDGNGRAGHIVAPDGKTTDLTYNTRGWLTQADFSDGTHTQTTGYTYDGTGQLTVVTMPDSGTLTYTYDNAHRLTDITDNLGDTVHYVLDNMGNRTTEQVKDPGGTLTRQITRVYDAINRLQTITGGVQ